MLLDGRSEAAVRRSGTTLNYDAWVDSSVPINLRDSRRPFRSRSAMVRDDPKLARPRRFIPTDLDGSRWSSRSWGATVRDDPKLAVRPAQDFEIHRRCMFSHPRKLICDQKRFKIGSVDLSGSGDGVNASNLFGPGGGLLWNFPNIGPPHIRVLFVRFHAILVSCEAFGWIQDGKGTYRWR